MEPERSGGAGERGEGGRGETKTGRKGRSKRRRRTTKAQDKKAAGVPQKCIKTQKNKIKLKTNLMDITEAEFPPEVQNMRALE